MRFTWDERKRRANIRKHGIDFVDAVEIFAGPNSSHDLHPDDALTVKGSFQIPLNQECQSSASLV